jgi:formate hydrogenlyase transcriptional activator
MIEKRTLKLLQNYEWPGNVRELQNVVERAVVLCDGDNFLVEESWLRGTTAQGSGRATRSAITLAEGERELIVTALKESSGKISGPLGAARKLGIPRQTLESKVKALNIDAASFRAR